MLFILLENDRPSKQDLSTHIVPSVAYIWKALGNALLPCDLVEREELCIIEANNPGNVKECCEEMFDKWLKADKDASWRQLIKALQQPGVELNYLADDIKNKLQKRGGFKVGLTAICRIVIAMIIFSVIIQPSISIYIIKVIEAMKFRY